MATLPAPLAKAASAPPKPRSVATTKPLSPAAVGAQAQAAAPVAVPAVLNPRYTPFTVPKWVSALPIPAVKQPVAEGALPPASWRDPLNIAPEYYSKDPNWQTNPAATHWYQLEAKPGVQQIVAGKDTPIWGYDGQYPGPLFKTRVGEPAVVRAVNKLPEEISIHLHGGHQPSHADGHPTFVMEPNQYWDYYYPFTVPINADGSPDVEDAPSTLFYHDHTMDLTSKHVLSGLAGFWEAFDDRELNLIGGGVLPGWDSSFGAFNADAFLDGMQADGKTPLKAYDIPLAIQDRRFNADGTIFWDPNDHDGYLGDVTVVNGSAYPVLTVEPRKYRFRILNGANARFFNLKLSDGQPFIGIGKDDWLYPKAIQRNDLYLGNAERADVVVDFSKYKPGDTVYLENNLMQTSGRGPQGTPDQPKLASTGEQILKFVVAGSPPPAGTDATIKVGDDLRPFVPLNPSDAKVSRTFEIHRRNGHWQINQKDYNPNRVDANPKLGDVERWTFVNKSGGWAHAMHVHSSGHQVLSYNGKPPSLANSFRNDMVDVGPNGVAELLVEFRTYDGPFVFHCHNVEHEDLYMMGTLDATNNPVPIGGPISKNFTPVTSSHFHWFSAPAVAAAVSAALRPALQGDGFRVGSPRGDRMLGREINDRLNGSAGDDLIKGNGGSDEIYGGAGDDDLRGGTGDDLLCGGEGVDRMAGGSGADHFWVNSREDAAEQDLIIDFDGLAGDRIRLDPALLDEAAAGRRPAASRYRLRESGGFTGQGGEVVFAAGVLQADLDGDQRADLALRLPGVEHFHQDWLMQ